MSNQKPEPINVHPEPVHCRLTPGGFQVWANQFLCAAETVEETSGFSPVRYFLACRAIELALKAFLLTRGCKSEKLKSELGHDLRRALEWAERNGLKETVNVNKEERQLVQNASAPYRSKYFEYFESLDALSGFPSRPDLAHLLRVARKLVDGIRSTCLNE